MNTNNLKTARKNNQMTQKQVSDHLKISPNTYKNYEQGLREPNGDMTVKLAELFNVTTDYLLGRESNEELSRGQMESEIIETFTDLPPKMRKILLETAEKLVEASKESNDE